MFSILTGHNVHVFNESFTSLDELASQLAGFEALVVIRERTQITEQLLSQLPDLKLISQTGKISHHIDPDA